MTRPLCPACIGTRTMGDKHPRPCTCCEDGHMRGIDDPTPEERRIAELRGLLGDWLALHERGHASDEVELLGRTRVALGAESDRLGGGA